MTFLSWPAIAIAAGLTIPPLIALYFLKLKRAVRPVPSTLLWRKAIEDLHVNSPFQRLRSSLLLFLQLLVLILAAVALGKPIWKRAQPQESTVILLIDQSASMAVVEADGRTRLDAAKEQAKRCVENMSSDSRAMMIAFCDRASVVSSFDADKSALLRKIDTIEQTQSTSTLGEAISLAEAYTQNIIIGTEEAGSDKKPESIAPPASVFLFTDGRIEDADRVVLQKFEVDKMTVNTLGRRKDNAGIIAMEARRNYEQPELLEVAATVQNFGPNALSLDAVLYVEGRILDVKTVPLDAGAGNDSAASTGGSTPPGSVATAAFDPVEFGGGGVVEVVLRVDDALPADDHAWTIVDEPRNLRVLLVADANPPLERVLSILPLSYVTMSPEEYEKTDDANLTEGGRSAFDVIILDGHSTGRLPRGNYFFWGAVPKIEGVSTGRKIDDEVIFNWDDSHPVLRHVAAESIDVMKWVELKLPREAVLIMEGQSSPVLSYLARDGGQFLLCAFRLIEENDAGERYYNTDWVQAVDFVVFMYNAIQFLSGNVAMTGQKSVTPGQPVTLPIPHNVEQVTVHRPNGAEDLVPTAGYETVNYARTRDVGLYRVEPGLPGGDRFAVNLFNTVESRVEPAPTLTIGTSRVESRAGTIEVDQPAWPYVLIALLVLLLLEWVIYNQRVFV